MFSKLLIANRGEIACRVIATARRMGMDTVAIYSDVDANSLHVELADEAVAIGGKTSRESYLDIDKVIGAAIKTGAQAIHPGYGFLSENGDFCRACEANAIVFVGPPATAIEAMGSKSAAKTIMEEADVPLVPGYHGTDQAPDLLRASAEELGYPVLLKAAAGGGGKGMRQVWEASEFDAALAAARREALNSFGDDKMLVEKYLTRPRHVEFQVFCDGHGNAVYLFERDCSLQRRHQKVIEEAPAPGMTVELRRKMGETAVRAARAIDYRGAGTVEFLLDADDSFYFMEMNTRLQVEHPVTEMITGQDLVEWQLKVADRQALPLQQSDLAISGHAFEARIYAEDPDNDFLPVTGKLQLLQPPITGPQVRVDTGVREGDEVSVFYDPMLAKLIVWDEDRDRALQRLQRSLRDYCIAGIKTNLPFLHKLASSSDFAAANLETRFIEHHHEQLFGESEIDRSKYLLLAALFLLLSREQRAFQRAAASPEPGSPWHSVHAWRMNAAHIELMQFELGDEKYDLAIEPLFYDGKLSYRMQLGSDCVTLQGKLDGNRLQADIAGDQQSATVACYGDKCTVFTAGGALEISLPQTSYQPDSEAESVGALRAPMNGTIVALMVKPGEPVKKGETLLVMEAMKMEHSIVAPQAGVVKAFYYQAGALVDDDAELLDFSVGDDA